MVTPNASSPRLLNTIFYRSTLSIEALLSVMKMPNFGRAVARNASSPAVIEIRMRSLKHDVLF